MRDWDAAKLTAAAEAELVAGEAAGMGPRRAVIDSREVVEGDLFVGLPGEHADGGEFAASALDAGAWGVLVGREHAAGLVGGGRVLAAKDPLVALQTLAHARRKALSARVLGITGSTGKTSVKDIAAAMLPGHVYASRANFNTEIGLPLSILEAPPETELLVLEMAMRGAGQIRELCEIAEPDVVVITNVGPVHLELLGSLEAVAAAKAEALWGLGEGHAVVPAEAGPLEPHLTGEVRLLRFGDGGDVYAREQRRRDPASTEALVVTPVGERRFSLPFSEAYHLENTLAAIGAGVALELSLDEMARLAPRITFSALRGEVVSLPGEAILINDSYNANPVSMRAALDHLGSVEVEGRRIAVLGEMRELGPEAATHHREVGAHARAAGADYVIGVGELGAAYDPDQAAADAEAAAVLLRGQLGPGDAVLVKGSRAIGLEKIAELLAEPR
ncbi:MAG: UDP-N-acetylmuramoyl-tripeptide--D-alanyl-D-alanine ligase [Solirubrobacterales bacterium]